MKLKINDIGGIVDPELLEPITRRIEGVFAQAGLKDVVVNMERRIASGKAGFTVGPIDNNTALPFSVQCGKGKNKFRGRISVPDVHVAQVLTELDKISHPSLKVLTGPSLSLKRKRHVSKSKMTDNEASVPPVTEIKSSPVASLPQSDLQQKIAQLEAVETRFKLFVEEINALTGQISNMKKVVEQKEKEIEEFGKPLALLARLRKELGLNVNSVNNG